MNKNNQSSYKCPICDSTNITELINKKLITFLFPVPKNTITKIKNEKINIQICLNCSHVFQIDINDNLINLIYSEFYKNYNLDTSAEFQNVYRDRTVNFIDIFLNKYDKTNANMLDIGCGEGTYFPYFLSKGYTCYGFEPSNKHLIAREKNPRAIISSSYFEEANKNIFHTKFDIILLNWVLEHVVDLSNFFMILKNYCKSGTKIIIQVPDLMYYIENDLYLFYVHEHIHYFSHVSIEKCLNNFGFKILSYKNKDCPSLLVCAEYIGKYSKINFKNNIDKLCKSIVDFVDKGNKLSNRAKHLFNNYNEIYFYGIGTVSYWLSEYCLSEKIKSKVKVIDDNDFYFGKIAPSFNKKIIKISEVGTVQNATFFIGTSPVYRNRIIRKIKKNVSGKYDLVFIQDEDFKIISN